MNFTLVSTIFNESKRLAQTIADLEAQTVQPSEIIITDAGSNDGSWQMLQDWKQRSQVPIVLLQENRCNVARGRNLAIAAAKYDLIVSTDFGCRFKQKWLEELVSPFLNKDVAVVGGAYSVDEDQIESKAAKANFILTNGYYVDIQSWFIPSSRSIAYYKQIWESVGKYPEWLTLAADDLVFGMKLKAKGYKWHIVDKPNVLWLRHTKPEQYAKESFRYGLGDGEAGVNLRNTFVVCIEQALKVLFFISSVFLFLYPIVSLVLMVLSIWGFRSYKNIFTNWLRLSSKKYSFSIFIYSFYLFELNRINYLKGYFSGYYSKRADVKTGRAELQNFLKQQ